MHRQASLNSGQSRPHAGLSMDCKRVRTTARVLSTNALMPKSAIFASPVRFIKMLAGFMSRWTYKSHASVQPMSGVDCNLSSSICMRGHAVCLQRCKYDSPCSTCPVTADRVSSGTLFFCAGSAFQLASLPNTLIPAHAHEFYMHAHNGWLEKLAGGGHARAFSSTSPREPPSMYSRTSAICVRGLPS